jgi:hypothetical protein
MAKSTGDRRKGGATTSPVVASKAAKVLGDEGATADERSVAASALAQVEQHDARVEQHDVGIDDPQAIIETLEKANGTLQAEIARLSRLAEQVSADIAALQVDNQLLKDQVRWYKENAKVRG